MPTRSSTEDQQFIRTDAQPEATAEEPPQPRDPLRKRVQAAEVRARALESENRQLRSERARALLAAARAEKAAHENPPLAAEAPAPRLDALADGMKVAEDALRIAEREREAAIRAVEEDLRKKFTQRVETIRLSHAAQLTALSQEAEMRARQVVKLEIELLIDELKQTEEALRDAEQERDAALRIVAEAKELPQRIAAMRQSHAAELEAQAQQAKKRFAQELMATLSTAHADWKRDTERRLQRASEAARQDLQRAKAAWRRRSRVALWRIARLWRRREQKRLADANRTWARLQRQALETSNRRWRSKFERLKKRTRRRDFWASGLWRRLNEWIAALAKTHAGRPFGEGRRELLPAAAGSRGAHTGLVAMIVVVAAVQFSSAEWCAPEGTAPIAAAVTAQAAPPASSAQLADSRLRDARPRAAAAPGGGRNIPVRWNVTPVTKQDRAAFGAWPIKPAAAAQTRSHTVAGIQRNLRRLGYDPGPVDGVLGPKTKTAIARFEGDQRLAAGRPLEQLAKDTERLAATPPKNLRNAVVVER